jgi:tRNA(fMet)-specific endonuclease VapC
VAPVWEVITATFLITHGELLYGAHKSHHPKKARVILQDLISLIPSLPMPTEASEYYGEIRGHLEKQGKSIGNNDLWIASHALALDLIIITNTVREFSRITHLRVENWVE